MTSGVETIEEQAALMDKIPDSYVLSYFQNLMSKKRNLINSWTLPVGRSSMPMEDDAGRGIRFPAERRTDQGKELRMTERIIP